MKEKMQIQFIKSEEGTQKFCLYFFIAFRKFLSLLFSFPFITLVNVSLIKKGRSIYAVFANFHNFFFLPTLRLISKSQKCTVVLITNNKNSSIILWGYNNNFLLSRCCVFYAKNECFWIFVGSIREEVNFDDEFLSRGNWEILYGLYTISAPVKLCKISFIIISSAMEA